MPTCTWCNGSGDVYDEITGRWVTCSNCGGSGETAQTTCSKCDGSGQLEGRQTYKDESTETWSYPTCDRCGGSGYLD